MVGDGSLLFPDDQVWLAPTLDELYRRYNENLLVDDRTFEEKLHEQLGEDRQDVTRLAAEVLLVYFAFAVHAVNGPRKRELIVEVLGWGGDALDETAEPAKAMDAGVGNPGQGFNNFRWRHVAYFVAFARRLKDLDSERRKRCSATHGSSRRGWSKMTGASKWAAICSSICSFPTPSSA